MPTADLTVIMPNYNHARYLPRSLGAIFAQSVQPREVIVIDDASTDDSLAVLESHARLHPALRVERNVKNLGVVGTLNRGVNLAGSRYLFAAGADDYLLPGFFEKLLSVMERHPTAGLAFANDTFQVGEHGRVEPNATEWPEEPGFYDAEGVCRYLRTTIPGHATIFRTQTVRDAGGYIPELAWYCDWFLNLTVAFRHGACHVPEPLAVRVLLDGAYSSNAKPGARHIAVLKDFFDRITSPEYADIAPYFRKLGGTNAFGTDMIRAAASRPDLWTPKILGFLGGFTVEQYSGLLDDPNPVVREVASIFLGPFWRRNEERRIAAERASQAELNAIRNELEAARRRIPPPGATGKVKWLASLALKRLRRAG